VNASEDPVVNEEFVGLWPPRRRRRRRQRPRQRELPRKAAFLDEN
jgi:hypothetical protein